VLGLTPSCLFSRLRKIVQGSRRGLQRCRGCGYWHAPTSLDENPVRAFAGRPTPRAPLCATCRTLVDQLRQNESIAAVFIFNRANQTKYYAAVRAPAP